MKTPVLGSLFIKVASLKVCNFIKKRLQRRYFPVNIAKFLRTPILKSIYEQPLLHRDVNHPENVHQFKENLMISICSINML